MSDPHSPRPQTAELEPSDYLCPDCGHHIHRPQPCQWIFGAGEHPRPCPCPADPHSPRPPETEDEPGPGDLLEAAWGLIANASSGNWSKQSQEWQAAAKRWRTAYFDALPAVEPAASAETDAAWEALYAALGDDAAEDRGLPHWHHATGGTTPDQRENDKNGVFIERGAARNAIRDHRPLIEAAFREPLWHDDGDSCTGLKCANPEHGWQEAAIRSAGTPPASRDVLEGPFALCPVCGRPEQVEFRDDWQAAVEAGSVIPIVGCGNPWHYNGMEAPPEPVGGREALRDTTIESLLRMASGTGEEATAAERVLWADVERYIKRLIDNGLTDPALTSIAGNIRGFWAWWLDENRVALLASPPTGVSDGVALDVEAARLVFHEEYERQYDLGGCRHKNQHRSSWDCTERADEFAAEYQRLAREQADSGDKLR